MPALQGYSALKKEAASDPPSGRGHAKRVPSDVITSILKSRMFSTGSPRRHKKTLSSEPV